MNYAPSRHSHDQRGFAHFALILALIVIIAIAFIGVKIMKGSHADSYGTTIVGLAGKCVDNSGNDLVSRNRIQLWGCNGTAAQKWDISQNTIRMGTFCIDVPNASKVTNTNLQLWNCNGTVAQTWIPQSNGTILNPNSNMCLDVESANSTNGTAIQIHECNTTAGELWKFVGGNTPTVPPAGSAASSTMTVASWNTRYDNTSSNLGSSVKNVTDGAQIVGLQEVHDPAKRRQIRDLLTCSSCGYATNVTDFSYDGSSPSSLMILWQAGRFTRIGSAGSLQVSEKTTVNDSAGESVSAKWITWVKLQDNLTGKQFYFLDTHTVASVESLGKPNTNNPKRLELYKTHMDKLTAKISALKAENIPVFVAGDFNVNYRRDITVQNAMFPYVRLGALNMRSNYNTLNLAGIPLSGHTSGSDDRLIDYVWSPVRSDVTVTGERIGTSSMGSDHFPIFTGMTLLKIAP